MIQAPNCSNQRDEDMKLSHTRHETRERHQASKQATSNKKQQEPIDEGTKNSTSLPQPTTPSLTRASSWSSSSFLNLLLLVLVLVLVLVLEREVDWDWYNDWWEREQDSHWATHLWV